MNKIHNVMQNVGISLHMGPIPHMQFSLYLAILTICTIVKAAIDGMISHKREQLVRNFEHKIVIQ